MSRDTVKALFLHLTTVALMAGCMLNVGTGERQIYLVVEGALLWPILGTLKDLYMQIRHDLQLA